MNQKQPIGKAFTPLANEAHLMRSAFRGGVESLRKGSVVDKGAGLLYEGWFLISTGFERLVKLLLIYDYLIDHDGLIPPTKYVKAYSHSVLDLYYQAQNVANRRDTEAARFFPDSTSPAWGHLKFYSDYAVGARYYNLNDLSRSDADSDPLRRWMEIIRMEANDALTGEKRADIQRRAAEFASYVSSFGMSVTTDNTRVQIDNHEVPMTQLLESEVIGHCVWRVIELGRPLAEMASDLTHVLWTQQQPKGTLPAPYLSEFVTMFHVPKRDALRKKRWRDN